MKLRDVPTDSANIAITALAADPDEWLREHVAALVEPYREALADLIGGVPHERRNEKRCNTCGQGWPCDNERARALLGAPQDGAR